MSYSETHTTSVHYSGSVTYHYPASEHGGSGTAHYSGSVPVSINVYVETDEFDRSVEGTKQALSTVAVALTAAQAAQIAEIKNTGKRVAESATKGFMGVMAGEISARISEYSSGLRSSAGLLVEEGRQVEAVHAQMKSDYAAIKTRYMRVFAYLDDELDRRVRELDRAAFGLGTHAMQDVVHDPFRHEVAQSVVQSEEVGATQLKLQCARMKRRALESLLSLGEVCTYITDYADAVEDIMEPSSASLERARQTSGRVSHGEYEDASQRRLRESSASGYVYAPVVYAEERDLHNAQQCIVVHGGALERPETNRAVAAQVASGFSGREKPASPEESDAVDRGFGRLLERYTADGGDPKTAQLIARMYQQDRERFSE